MAGRILGMVRSATPGDLASIARLIRGLAEYEGLSREVSLDEERLREHVFGPRPFAEALIAENEGRAVGYALFFHSYSTFLGRPGTFLEDLFVEPERRGKGHGKALLGAVARIAVERGCGRVEWAVLNWNEPAMAFYLSLDAVPLDEWTGFRLTGDALRAAAGLGGEPRA